MIRPRPAGSRAVVLDLDADGDPASVATSVRRLADRLSVTLTDVVPGARTVLVVAADPDGLHHLLAALPQLSGQPEPEEPTGTSLELPARYDGPDLQDVAHATGLSVEDVVRRHSGVTYRAAFSGFAPGFVYLSGLDPLLRLPRRDTPRTAVPAGSVAIADTWTAVYPCRTPGGWHLLGTVDVPVFEPRRTPAALISPGQGVRFVPASP